MILINGSTGMIGSYLKSKLDCETFGKNGVYLDCDLTDIRCRDSLKASLSKARVIVHLEAFGANDDSYKHVDSIVALRNVIECMPQYCQLIYISTCSLYANASDTYSRQDEESPINLSTAYLRSKAYCEEMIKDRVLRYTILRLSNVISKNMKHGIIYDWKENKSRGDNISIGNKYPGSIRSFIDIDSVALAIKLCIDKPVTFKQVINVCASDSTSLTEIADIMMLKITEYVNIANMTMVQPDSSKMISLLGFDGGCSGVNVVTYLHDVGYFKNDAKSKR